MTDYRDKTFLKKESLIIMEPAVQITGWTVHAGSVYKAAVSHLPSRVTRNSTSLTLVAALVDLDASTEYYYDGTYVYIYTYAVDDYMVLYFEQYFGSLGYKLPRDLDLAGSAEVVWFEPRVQGNPSFSRSAKDWMSGVTVNGDCNFDLIETDDHLQSDLHAMLENYSYINKIVRVYRYLDEEDTQDIMLIFKGLVDSWIVGRTLVSFTAKDYAVMLDDYPQTLEYNTTSYPNVDPNYIGKVVRVVYGKCMIRCVNIDYVDQNPTTSDNRVWNTTAHQNKSVLEVYVRGVLLTPTTHYTLDANKTQITMSATLETDLGWDQNLGAYEEVFALVEGKMDGSSNLIDNASDIVKDLLLSVGFTTDDMNTASFTQAKTDCTYKIGIALPQSVDSERPTCRELIEWIDKSVLGYITNDDDFKIKFKIYAAGSSTRTLDTEADLIGRSVSAQTFDMASLVVIKYAYSERVLDYLTSSTTSKKCKYLHENGKSNTIETVLSDSSDAAALALRYGALYENAFVTEDFTVKLQLDQHHIGDFVEIDGRTCEIIKLDKSVKEIVTQARRL